MGFRSRTIVSSAVLALAARVSAQVASVCPSTNVCFKLNIPASTASSGTGDVFFQISAPSSYEWVALGQGSGMSGANMFLVYTSSGGTNVTLSPRTASGQVMPSFNSAAKVTLLEGSGVSNGIMTANVRCSSCNSWSGGSMDFKASKGEWIYAFQPSNGPKNSNDQSASIRQHTGHAAFAWDFANAKGGSSVNPLVNAAPAGSGSATGGAVATSCIQRNAASASGAGIGSVTSGAATPTQSSDDSNNNNNNNDDSRGGRSRYTSAFGGFPTARPSARPPTKRATLPYCDELVNGGGATNSGFQPIAASGSGGNQQTMLIAHGVLASLAFVILFPAGSIAIRLASFPGVVWLHAAFQVFAYLVYIAAFGIGVYLATQMKLLNNYHPIIGIVVVVAIFFQPILGFLHHSFFKKNGRRTMWSHAHIWLGRIAITLGIINGGLGLKLADNSRSGKIAYGVVAGFMWLAWVTASVIGERKRKAAIGSAAPHVIKSTRHGSDGSDTTEVLQPGHGHYAPKMN